MRTELVYLLFVICSTTYIYSAEGANAGLKRFRTLTQTTERILLISGPIQGSTVGKKDFPIEFTVPDNKPTECLLSKGPITVVDWFHCESPLPLEAAQHADGEYTLRIRVIPKVRLLSTLFSQIVGDPALVMSSEAVVTFFMDITPPDTAIVATKIAKENSNDAYFEFESSDADLEYFECELDYSEQWEICDNPKVYQDLVHGEHVFRVRAVDRVGNADDTPSQQFFSVELPAPSKRSPPTSKFHQAEPPPEEETQPEESPTAEESTLAPVPELVKLPEFIELKNPATYESMTSYPAPEPPDVMPLVETFASPSSSSPDFEDGDEDITVPIFEAGPREFKKQESNSALIVIVYIAVAIFAAAGSFTVLIYCFKSPKAHLPI